MAAGALTGPASPTRGSSWATVEGKSSDVGRGVAEGKLLIEYSARDRAGNASARQQVEQTISR